MRVEWNSYEMPSYGIKRDTSRKLGIVGGLGVVTDEILSRISGDVDLYGVGSNNLRGEDLPTFEEIDGYKVIRPLFRMSTSQFAKSFIETLERGQVQVTGSHLSELQFIPFLQDYSASIPAVIMDQKPDLICAHDWMSILGVYDKAESMDVPWMTFIHSLESGRQAGMVHTPLGPTEARHMGMYSGSRIIRDIEVLGIKESDVCFTVGKTMVNEVHMVAKGHGVPPKKIQGKVFPIHHGVDTKTYRPMPNMEKEYDVIFIGRFAIVKGILELLDATKILKTYNPDIKILVIGGGELEGQIREKVKSDYLEKNVIIDTKWYQKEEKTEVINKSRVAIAPSKYEPHGQYDLEAGACGIPCIAGTGGFSERMIEGVTGVQCDPFSPTDMAAKIMLLLKDQEMIEEMGMNSRDFIAKYYGWDHRAKVYPPIFEHVVNKEYEKLNELELVVDLEDNEFLTR